MVAAQIIAAVISGGRFAGVAAKGTIGSCEFHPTTRTSSRLPLHSKLMLNPRSQINPTEKHAYTVTMVRHDLDPFSRQWHLVEITQGNLIDLNDRHPVAEDFFGRANYASMVLPTCGAISTADHVQSAASAAAYHRWRRDHLHADPRPSTTDRFCR